MPINLRIEAFKYRHACKEFDIDRKITKEEFDFILETARLSPSSFGFEPWKFIVLQDSTLRKKLIPVTWGGQKQLKTASHFIVILARTKKDMSADSDYILNIMRNTHKLPENIILQRCSAYEKFLYTDFKLFENERAMFEWSCRQTYLALGNMLTSAAHIGIDSCPIEGFNKDKVEDILVNEGLMDKNRFGISSMVAFGYRVNQPREKTRQTIKEIVQWVQ
ncbi:NAD(P)H-dependent oxidoreductase [Bacillus gaemokensis]|uniref:NAD(P)H nitroreductase YfkO n=1 Tax=Bacillus gaemokensis TaxID=574375 RepID=A0A073K717_9BACI|nr:NAD(P)H-dependent oxidoreductase [Bacillus gaemokensis]KEK23069.1 NAD(P)H nitroreductase YfkO [Bacillus gaemokensis]KYG37740.1 NAD(P)H-dependent oxidoreductase [Bacillus gaemokensis]